jgi:hypothetical protein
MFNEKAFPAQLLTGGPPNQYQPGPAPLHAADAGMANVRDFLHCSTNRNLIVTLKSGIDCNKII